MAFNKNKKIVTTALTAAMVASAVAPVAAATKTVTPVQAATKAVDAYYKLSVKTKADVQNSAKVKKVALTAIAKLGKKDAKVKASLTAKVAKKSAAINKYYQTVIVAAEVEAKNIATAKAALEAAKAFVPTAETKVEDVEKMFVDGMALINKIKTESVKADLIKQATDLKAAVLKKIEELKLPKVDSVTAITKTTVDVVLPKVTVAKEDFKVVVKDPAGNVVDVKAINLEIGDSAVTFTFVTPLSSVALGDWTVNGTKFDTKAVAAVDAVNSATNQVELLTALQSSYFTGTNKDNIAKYQTILAGLTADKKSSVALIQANVIDAGNKQGVEADAVKAVNDANTTNQVKLLEALQSSYFKRVNASYIGQYDLSLNGTQVDVAAVQTIIDTVNLAQANAAVTTAEGLLDRSALSTASTAVSFVIDDVTGVTTKKALLDRIALHTAVVTVSEANTNAKLTNALNTLAGLSTAIVKTSINETLLTDYRAGIAAAVVADKNTAAEIQVIINAKNTAAETAAVTALANVTMPVAGVGGTTVAQFKELAAKLDALSTTFDATKVLDAKILGVGGYVDAIVSAVAGDKDSAAELQTIIVNVNAPTAAVTALDTEAANPAKTADSLLAALKATTLTLTNVVDANKAQYLADVADIATAADASTPALANASVTNLKKVIDASNAVVALNGASTAAVARDALSTFALATGNTGFLNLSTTAKLEVAELVLAAKATAGAPFATSASVTAEITTQTTAQAALVSGVNAATTISDMDTALDAIGYSAYKELSAVKQLEVAESFLNAFPKTTVAPITKINYTTITAIKADVDKAIAATK